MAWVTGRVVSTAGAPVPGVTVGDARRSLNVVTDRNGRYFLPVVRGARTVLSVLKPGFAPRTVVTSIAGLTGAADDAVVVATQPAALTESGSDRWFAVSSVPVRVLVPAGADVTALQVQLAWYDHNDHFPEVMPEPAWVAGVHVTANAPLPAGTVLEVTTAYGLPVATAIPGWRFAGDDLGFGVTPLPATAQVQSGSPSAVIRMALPAAGSVLLGLAHDSQGPGQGLQVSERGQYRGFGEPMQTGPWSWLVDGRYLRAAALPRPPGAPTDARSPTLVYDSLAAQGRFVAEPQLYAAPWVTSTPTAAKLVWSAGGNIGAVDLGTAWTTRSFPLVLDGADAFGPAKTGLVPLDYHAITEWGAQYAATTSLPGEPGANLEVPTRFSRRAHTGLRGLVAVVSDRDSPYGIGWWPREVPRLVVSPTHAGRWLYVTDGHGQIPSIADTLQPVLGATATAPMRPDAALSETDLGGVVDMHDTGAGRLLVTTDNPGAATGGVVALVDRGTYLATVAGGAVEGAGGDIGDGGPATAANLASPRAAILAQGQGVVIADTGHHRVRRVIGNVIQSLAGTGSAGSSGLGGLATSAALNTPSGLAVGLDGLVWIADTGNHRLVRVTATGNLQLALDAAPNLTPPTLASPRSLCATETHLYVADTGNKRILRVDSAGTVTLFAGNGTSTAPLDGSAAAEGGVGVVEDLALSPDNELWFTESSQGKVWRIDAAGVTHLVAGGGSGGEGSHRLGALLEKPTALAMAMDGSAAWVAARIGPSANHRGLGVLNLTDGFALQSSLKVSAANANVRQVQRADGHIDTFDGDGSGWRFRDRKTASGTTVFAASWNTNGQPASLTTAAGTWSVSGYGTARLTLTSQAGFETRLVRADGKLITFLHPDGQAHRFDTNAAGQIELDRGPSLYRVALAYRADGIVSAWSGTSGESGSLTKPACAPFGAADAACLSSALGCAGGCGGSCGQTGFCAAGQCALVGSPLDGNCAPWAVPEPAVCASPPCGAPTCSGGQDWSICAAGPPTCTACCCQGSDCQMVLGLGNGCGCGGNGDCAAAEPGVGGVCEANPACGGGGGAGGADGGVSDVVDGGGAACAGPQSICKVDFLGLGAPGACNLDVDCLGQGGPCTVCVKQPGMTQGTCGGTASGTPQGGSCGGIYDVCVKEQGGACGANGCELAWHTAPQGAVHARFRHPPAGSYDFCVRDTAMLTQRCGTVHETRLTDRTATTVGIAIYFTCAAGKCIPLQAPASASPPVAAANLVARVCNGVWAWFAKTAPNAMEITCIDAAGWNAGWVQQAASPADIVVEGSAYQGIGTPELPHICPRSVCDLSRTVACDHQLGCRDSASTTVKANLAVNPAPAGATATTTGPTSIGALNLACANGAAFGSPELNACVSGALCGATDPMGQQCRPRVCGPAGRLVEFMGCDGGPCELSPPVAGNTFIFHSPPLAVGGQSNANQVGVCRQGLCENPIAPLQAEPSDPQSGPPLPWCSDTVMSNCKNPRGHACNPWSWQGVRRYQKVESTVPAPTAADNGDATYVGSTLSGLSSTRRVRYHVRAWPGWAAFLADTQADGSEAHPFMTISQAIMSPRRLRCNEVMLNPPGAPATHLKPTVIEIAVAPGAMLEPPHSYDCGPLSDDKLANICPNESGNMVVQITGVLGGSLPEDSTGNEPCHLVITGKDWADQPLPSPSSGHNGCHDINDEGYAHAACGTLNHRYDTSKPGCPTNPDWPLNQGGGAAKLTPVYWNGVLALYRVANVVVRGLDLAPASGTAFRIREGARGLKLGGLRALPMRVDLYSTAEIVEKGVEFKGPLAGWYNSQWLPPPPDDGCFVAPALSKVTVDGSTWQLTPPHRQFNRFVWLDNGAEDIDISRTITRHLEYVFVSGESAIPSTWRGNAWRLDAVANRLRRLAFRENYLTGGGKELQLYLAPMVARTGEWAADPAGGTNDPMFKVGSPDLPPTVSEWSRIRVTGNWIDSFILGRKRMYTGPATPSGGLTAADVGTQIGKVVKWFTTDLGNATLDLANGEKPCDTWIGGYRGVQTWVVDNLQVGAPRTGDSAAPAEPAAIAELRGAKVDPTPSVQLAQGAPTAPGCVLFAGPGPAPTALTEPKIFQAPSPATSIVPGGNVVRFGQALLKPDGGGGAGYGFNGDLGSGDNFRGYSHRLTVRGNTMDHAAGAVLVSHARDVEVVENRVCDANGSATPYAVAGALSVFAVTEPSTAIMVAGNEVSGAYNRCGKTEQPALCAAVSANGSAAPPGRVAAFSFRPRVPVGLTLSGNDIAPFRFGHNIAWRAEYGVLEMPARKAFRAEPLESLSFYSVGQAGGPSSILANYKLPVSEPAVAWSGNLLGAAPYTHALTYRFVAPFTATSAKVETDTNYGVFGWGWRQASYHGDRIAVSATPAGPQPCMVDSKCTACNDQGLCICGDKGMCTLDGRRILPFQQGIAKTHNWAAYSSVCQWASKDAWDASPQAKCIGKKPAPGVAAQGVDADATWWAFSAADARLGVKCCEATDEAMQLDDAEKVCPETVRTKFYVKLACPGKPETEYSCSQCQQQLDGKPAWACGWWEAGPSGDEDLSPCKSDKLPPGSVIVKSCSTLGGYTRGGTEPSVDQPLGHLARHKPNGGGRLDACAARSCGTASLPGEICMPATTQLENKLICEKPACMLSNAGRVCGWPDNTAAACPSGYEP